MGYIRPAGDVQVSSSWQDHKNRKPPSSEPGTDYACAYGTPVVAAADGKVFAIQTAPNGATGRYVTVDLDDGRRTRSLHLSSVVVSAGGRVFAGQLLGRSGASANGSNWGVGAHVHQSLFPSHSYGGFGSSSTLDFEANVGAGDGFSQVTADRQNFLNVALGKSLKVDGLFGPATKKAFSEYQVILRDRGWYTAAIDGLWGPAMQLAHEKFYAAWTAAQPPPPPAPQNDYPTASVQTVGLIGDVRGMQKLARLGGYKGAVDNKWGPGSKSGLQNWLNANYGGSLTSWLRRRWGYVGNEHQGPIMTAALQRANAENFRAL